MAQGEFELPHHIAMVTLGSRPGRLLIAANYRQRLVAVRCLDLHSRHSRGSDPLRPRARKNRVPGTRDTGEHWFDSAQMVSSELQRWTVARSSSMEYLAATQIGQTSQKHRHLPLRFFLAPLRARNLLALRLVALTL